MDPKHIQPYALASEEGEARWYLDTLIFVKATGSQTGGAFGLIEQVLPAGSETSYHIHREEEEYWYVLEGEVTFISGELRIDAKPGAFVFMPRDIPHGLRARTVARMLVLSTPAGFVDFAIEMSEPARQATLPPPRPRDLEKSSAIAAKYNIEVLGPLPE
jgi:quercetin dioxygenase-like cupin family protein